ncbi:hypothetical protein PLESTM_000869900 [Pleodorina starrii]|nr:hypothetical protein PLESTM_000869900 [Pleodorina starrii]
MRTQEVCTTFGVGIADLCIPPEETMKYVSTAPRPVGMGGTQQTLPHVTPPTDYCVNDSLRWDLRRCWPAVGLYIDLALDGFDVDSYSHRIKTGYVGRVTDSYFLCEVVMTKECIQKYDVLGCYKAILAGTSTSETSGGGGGSGGGSGNKQRLLLAIVLPSALGGVFAVALVVAAVIWAVKRQRSRTPTATAAAASERVPKRPEISEVGIEIADGNDVGGGRDGCVAAGGGQLERSVVTTPYTAAMVVPPSSPETETETDTERRPPAAAAAAAETGAPPAGAPSSQPPPPLRCISDEVALVPVTPLTPLLPFVRWGVTLKGYAEEGEDDDIFYSSMCSSGRSGRKLQIYSSCSGQNGGGGGSGGGGGGTLQGSGCGGNTGSNGGGGGGCGNLHGTTTFASCDSGGGGDISRSACSSGREVQLLPHLLLGAGAYGRVVVGLYLGVRVAVKLLNTGLVDKLPPAAGGVGGVSVGGNGDDDANNVGRPKPLPAGGCGLWSRRCRCWRAVSIPTSSDCWRRTLSE